MLTTTAFWRIVICHLVKASQLFQMPTWTGCLTFSKITNTYESSPIMLNVRPLGVRINMVCAKRNLFCTANYWPRAFGVSTCQFSNSAYVILITLSIVGSMQLMLILIHLRVFLFTVVQFWNKVGCLKSVELHFNSPVHTAQF